MQQEDLKTPPSNKTSSVPLRLAFGLFAAVVILGLALAGLIVVRDFNNRDLGLTNIFYVLYSFYEPAQLFLILLLLPVLYLGLVRSGDSLPGGFALERFTRWRWFLAVVAVAVLLFTWWGREKVFERLLFSQDEMVMTFQAEIFAEGLLEAPVPEEWQPFAKAMAPIFVTYEKDSGTWMASYLPIYAGALALALKAGLEAWLNPLLAMLCLVVLHRLVRVLWPEGKGDAELAVLLLAVSPQFLVTAMTGYTMTAHLLMSLLWLLLYAQNSRRALLALPWVGAIAMGLHAFVPHALFAIPFLLRMVAQRRFRLSAYVATVYLFASAVWIYWLLVVNPTIVGAAAARFGVPGVKQFLSQSMSLALLASWQCLPLGLLAVIGILSLRRADTIFHDVALSCAFTFGFYFLFLHNQGHGWGNRYFHPALGNLVVLAMLGWHRLRATIDRRAALGFVATGLLVALLVQLPLRLYQVRDFTGPFRQANAWLKSLEEPVVLVPAFAAWYGQDLVRNPPFFEADSGPRLFFMSQLTPAQLEDMEEELGPIRRVRPEELEEQGMVLTRWAYGGFRVVTPSQVSSPPPR